MQPRSQMFKGTPHAPRAARSMAGRLHPRGMGRLATASPGMAPLLAYGLLLAWLLVPTLARAEDLLTAEAVQTHANYLWTLVAAFLVFFMQAGFAMVETGFTRAKSSINIMMKNMMDFCVGSLAYWAVGFGLMFGTSNGLFGTDNFFLSGFAKDHDPWIYCFWMFQVVFAATAATIVSGAMAERTKFVAYLIYSAFISLFIYPIFGSWAWGSLFHGNAKGWLEGLGFIDFAGSTVVHSMGGWAALAGAICLGPRLGKYTKEGKPTAIPGHNIPLATLGVFILWFGWFGFNPGSTTAANTSTALIAVNTNLAAAAGAVFAMITAWVKFGKPEVGMTLNGTLAGLVAITAGCANLTPAFAVLTGAIAGVLVVVAVLVIDRIGVDDPVGAISVHGLNGAWGTLAAGLFNADKMFDAHIVGVQVIGILACFAWSFTLCFLLFKLMQKTIGLRVAPEEEYEGLDFHEHGGDAYPEFGHTAGTSLGSLPGRLESGADPPTARGASLLGMV